MKHIPTVYLVLMPYLNFLMLYIALSNQDKSELLILCIVLAVVFCIIGLVCCVVCNILSAAYVSDRHSAIRNVVIKLCHIPAHLGISVIVLGFMNPFLILFSWIPALFGMGLLAYSGAANICSCIKLWSGKKCSVPAGVALMLLGFFGIADIVAAFVQLAKSKAAA